MRARSNDRLPCVEGSLLADSHGPSDPHRIYCQQQSMFIDDIKLMELPCPVSLAVLVRLHVVDRLQAIGTHALEAIWGEIRVGLERIKDREADVFVRCSTGREEQMPGDRACCGGCGSLLPA